MKLIKNIVLLFALLIYFFIYTAPVLADHSTYPRLASENAVLMDAGTGQVLFHKNMNEKQYPASITKIMTGIIALEEGNLTDTLIMSNEAVFSIGRNSSHVALDVDEELTLEQALYALSIESANDAANGIAEYISGDLDSFAELMNKKAIEVGALNTNFVNAHGLPDSEHYTTAYDMAKIMLQAIKTPMFREFFSKTLYEMPPTNKQSEIRYFRNRIPLLSGKYEGIIASKTGWTSQANHTIVSAAKRGNRELIAVVMNNTNISNNSKDTIKLLDYGFKNFSEITLKISDIETTISSKGYINLEAENLIIEPDEDIPILLHKSLSIDDVETSYKFNKGVGNGKNELIISGNLKHPSNFMYESLGDTYLTFEAKSIKENKQFINVDTEYLNLRNYIITGLVLIVLFIIWVFVKRKRKKTFFRWQ